MWPCFLREVAADVRGFANQLHRDVYGDLETPSTGMSDAEELTDAEEAEEADACFWEGVPFGALTSVDVLTCPSGAKSRYGRHRCIEHDDCCSTSLTSSLIDAVVQTEGGYVEELQETVAALEAQIDELRRMLVCDTVPLPSMNPPNALPLSNSVQEPRRGEEERTATSRASSIQCTSIPTTESFIIYSSEDLDGFSDLSGS
mmetsp:Transcript_13006/g.12847  ORF Transcript_13006/g.12847 Transcript_13006/m.12847 type:complete len:202 (-) Transcript_13006:59-664(-)